MFQSKKSINDMVTTKNCPYCDEMISINAIKCKHCGSLLSVSPGISENMDPLTFIRFSLSVRYEILSEIGRGGMATVYKAIQRNLQRIVALKVIHQNLVHDQEFLERFHAEARMAASLNHPNIVSIYDEGIENNIHFISMEYLEGEDLHQKIRSNGKMNVEQTVNIISQVAGALDYIHKKGLIHRDIKSSNIIITRDGRALLTDFGIARAISGSKLSQTGSVMGTPEYMSPEQADGLRADEKSDLYSLGIVMYECLAGTVPFSGENPISTIYKIISTPPPPLSMFNNAVPGWLMSIVEKALAKNPKNRFGSGNDFAAALKKKKKVVVSEKPGTSSRTQKLDIKKIKNSPSKKPAAQASSSNVLFRNKSSSSSNTKILYTIGSIIIILLLVLVIMIFYNYSNDEIKIEDMIKDNKWIALDESSRMQVLSLINQGDKLMENNSMILPKGNSALEKYQEVLKIHPTDNYALIQSDKIFRDIYNQLDDALKHGEKDEVNSLSSLIRQYFPERETEVNALVENNDISDLLNDCRNQFSKSDLTLEELDRLANIISKVLDVDETNSDAHSYLTQLEGRYSGLGENYYSRGNYQDALRVFQHAKNNFESNNIFKGRISDCERKLVTESFIRVPELTGLSLAAATNTAENNGFLIGIISKIASDTKKGIVTNQYPVSGSRVSRSNAKIDILIGE